MFDMKIAREKDNLKTKGEHNFNELYKPFLDWTENGYILCATNTCRQNSNDKTSMVQ